MNTFTQRLRLLVVLARPAVVILVALFAATGLAQAGHANDGPLLAKVLFAVMGCLLFAVAVNDIADERIDNVNLPGNQTRPLAAGSTTRREMRIVAATSAVVALAASTLLAWPAPLVVAGGLALTAMYSLRPIRFAERGVVAPMLLPAGYVAVPYLLGILAGKGAVTGADLLLLAGLYAGFIGRIVLKDFRDVRGDALFGKRTFLVRHGRRATCAFSAAFLVAGVAVLPFVRALSVATVGAYVILLATTLGLLRALARSTSARRDEALISGIAIAGRGMIVTLYAHLALVGAHVSTAFAATVLAGITVVMVTQTIEMVRRGPLTRTTVPPSFAQSSFNATALGVTCMDGS